MKRILYCFLILMCLFSCTIQKRLYNSGWHIEWKTKHRQAENQIVSQFQKKSESENTKVINPKTAINDDLILKDSLEPLKKELEIDEEVIRKTKVMQKRFSYEFEYKKQTIVNQLKFTKKKLDKQKISFTHDIAVLIFFLIVGLIILFVLLAPANTFADLLSILAIIIGSLFFLILYLIIVIAYFSKKKKQEKENQERIQRIKKPKKISIEKERKNGKITLLVFLIALISTVIFVRIFDY